MIKPNRRWLRYSLRTLLIVFTLIAVVLGIRLNQIHRQRQAVEAIRALEGKVWYDDQDPRGAPQTGVMSAFKEFVGLRKPLHVTLSGKEITDDTLRQHVIQLTSLKYLGLLDVSITNEGLTQLTALESLKSLTCTRDPRHNRLLMDLETPTEINCQQFPLDDLLAFLKDRHNIELVADAKALSAAGIIANNVAITANVINIPLRQALDEILKPNGMGWIIADDKFVVTSIEVAQKNRKAIEDLKSALPDLVDVRVD